MNKIIIFSVVFILVSINALSAQRNNGFSFLKIDVDARAAAMAGSYSSLTQDASATFYNPAGLNLAKEQSFSAMYNDWLWDLSHSYAAIQFVQGTHNVALSFNYLQSPGVEIREEASEDPSGTTNPFYFSAAISYATVYDQDWNAGLTMKYLFEKSYLYSAPGLAFDIGIIRKEILNSTDFGFSIHNLGKMSKLDNKATALPVLIRTGLTMRFPDFYGQSFIVTPGLMWVKNERSYLKLGIEYHLNEYVFLRGGLRNGNEEMLWSTGFGVNFNNANLDYAYAPFEYNLGSSNRISLKIEF